MSALLTEMCPDEVKMRPKMPCLINPHEESRPEIERGCIEALKLVYGSPYILNAVQAAITLPKMIKRISR